MPKPRVRLCSMDDFDFMSAAIAQAERSEPTAARHPRVGAVFVQDSKIVDGAYRSEIESGQHAEFTLLHRKLRSKDETTGGTLYTTLEPCTTRSHDKRPCADWAIAMGIQRVVIGILDPNPVICGRGYWRLIQAGIQVDMFPHELADEIRQLDNTFIAYHLETPRVVSAFDRLSHRSKNVTIQGFPGFGWRETLSLQSASGPEGWLPSQIHLIAAEHVFRIPDNLLSPYEEYFANNYDSKNFVSDGEKWMLLQNPSSFTDQLELTRFPAHPIVSQGSQEGVPDGSPLEVPGRVPA